MFLTIITSLKKEDMSRLYKYTHHARGPTSQIVERDTINAELSYPSSDVDEWAIEKAKEPTKLHENAAKSRLT